MMCCYLCSSYSHGFPQHPLKHVLALYVIVAKRKWPILNNRTMMTSVKREMYVGRVGRCRGHRISNYDITDKKT